MSKENSIVYQRAFLFAVKIVKLYRYLSIEKKEFVLSKQILKSGTSIAANIREALEGQSRKDFIAKLSIALKEAGETEYWLELFIAAEVLKPEETTELHQDIKEIIKIINSIIRSSRNKLSS